MNPKVESTKLLKILNKRKLPEFTSLPCVCEFVTGFMMKHYGFSSERQINRGYCFIWAYLVWALNKEEVTFATTDGHVVVQFSGMFYDSEHPDGDECLSDLSLDPEEAAHVDVRGMSWYWARCGVAKKEFRSIMRNTYNSLYNSIRAGGFNDSNLDYSAALCVEDIP